MIYILEDDKHRVAQFQAAAALIAPDVLIRIWRSAPTMLADLVDGLEQASLISLDHDLNQFDGDLEDPGSGYDVVKVLAELTPCCPLIIHTSNGERGLWMIGELSRTSWRYERVYPDGDDWIEKAWAPVVRRLLGRKD